MPSLAEPELPHGALQGGLQLLLVDGHDGRDDPLLAEERADHGDGVVVADGGGADRGLLVELQSGLVGPEGDRLAVDRELQRLVRALAEGLVELVDGLVTGAAADVDAEDCGALGNVGVVHQQTGAVDTAAEDDHSADEQTELAAALLLGRLGGLRVLRWA